MPNAVVKSFAEKSGKSVAEVEHMWDEIKKGVAEDMSEDNPEFYVRVTGRLKKALKIESRFASFASVLSEDWGKQKDKETDKGDDEDAEKKKGKPDDKDDDDDKDGDDEGDDEGDDSKDKQDHAIGKLDKELKKVDESKFIVTAEYGVHASDYVEIKVDAKDEASARKKAEKELKDNPHWPRMKGNISVRLIEANDEGYDDKDPDDGKKPGEESDNTPQEDLQFVIDLIRDMESEEAGEEGEIPFELEIIEDIAEFMPEEVCSAVTVALVDFYGLEDEFDWDEDSEDDEDEEQEESLNELDAYIERMQSVDERLVFGDEDELDEAQKRTAKIKRQLFWKGKRKKQLGKRANSMQFKRNYFFNKKKRKFVKRKKPRKVADMRKARIRLKRIVRKKSTKMKMKRTKRRLASVRNPFAKR